MYSGSTKNCPLCSCTTSEMGEWNWNFRRRVSVTAKNVKSKRQQSLLVARLYDLIHLLKLWPCDSQEGGWYSSISLTNKTNAEPLYFRPMIRTTDFPVFRVTAPPSRDPKTTFLIRMSIVLRKNTYYSTWSLSTTFGMP